MFTVITIMIAGILAGLALKRHPVSGFIQKLVSPAIWLLLFLLGLSVGSDPSIMDNLLPLGRYSLFLATAGVIGSALAALAIWRLFFKKVPRK